MNYEDFPILLETWRTCFRDEFDMPHLKQVLEELDSGVISWSECTMDTASPFAVNAAWQQINQYMYERDDPSVDKHSKLSKDLLQEVVFDSGLRLPIPQTIIEGFEAKRQRLHRGYVPSSANDLLDWVVERILLPEAEWEALIGAGEREQLDLRECVGEIQSKVCWCQVSDVRCLSAIENLSKIQKMLGDSIEEVSRWDGEEMDKVKIPSTELEAMDVWGEWLSFYGPITGEAIQEKLGLNTGSIQQPLSDLLEAEQIVAGELVEGEDVFTYCDVQNYEFLLRLKRASSRPQFEPLPMESLCLFLADYQGVIDRGKGLDDLYPLLDQFLCYPAGAALWEAEILPSRFSEYQPSWMDSVFVDSEFLWFGSEGQRVGFGFEEDLELLRRKKANETSGLLPVGAKQDFATLLSAFDGGSAELNTWIWKSVWAGEIVGDSMAALRKGVLNKFRLPKDPPPRNPGHLRYRNRVSGSRGRRWKGALPVSGHWQRLPSQDPELGLIEQEEQAKERVRILLDRYGILFRELLGRELPGFQWRDLFRSLRLMELSGEVLSGSFFDGIPGPQFISHEAFRRLQRNMPENAIYWINAQDPASLCGLGLESLKSNLPSRLASNHLVYRGGQLVMETQRQGKVITVHVNSDDKDLPEIFGLFRHLLTRQFNPLKKIKVESINDEPVAKSPFLDALRLVVEVRIALDRVILERKY